MPLQNDSLSPQMPSEEDRAHGLRIRAGGRGAPLGMIAAILTIGVGLGVAVAQTTSSSATGSDLLATVRIAQPVLADGKPLPAGTYEIRLTRSGPAPMVGQSPDAQRVVELLAGGKVVAREVAEVLRDDDLTPVGASSAIVGSGVRVDMLQGGEFLRISVKRERERYLICLPVMR